MRTAVALSLLSQYEPGVRFPGNAVKCLEELVDSRGHELTIDNVTTAWVITDNRKNIYARAS